jgi:integrase/recombinase XerD
VPLHPTATAALTRYAAERDRLRPRAPSKAFFLSSAGTRLDRSSREQDAQEDHDLDRHPHRDRPPRAHDLRHSFAVDTLIRWQRSGLNIEENIATLSTYLGHVSPADTYWYLSASPELMGLAADRLHTRFGARP